ncbi:MAG: hypothetical protein AB8G14_07835 [Ilumatobacter sp.]
MPNERVLDGERVADRHRDFDGGGIEAESSGSTDHALVGPGGIGACAKLTA